LINKKHQNISITKLTYLLSITGSKSYGLSILFLTSISIWGLKT